MVREEEEKIIEIPIILFKRKNSYGVIKINGIQTPILERCILDLYFLKVKLVFQREILIFDISN